MPEYFIFEIGEMKPNYIFAVDHDKYREASYREFAGIDFEATCIFPKKLSGRPVSFGLMGQRDHMVPEAFKRDSSWKPRCVGSLDIGPRDGNYSMNVPYESLAFLATMFVSREARFVVLYGEPLSRGKSLCSTFHLEKEINLDDY
jgi:hypothetical protein